MRHLFLIALLVFSCVDAPAAHALTSNADHTVWRATSDSPSEIPDTGPADVTAMLGAVAVRFRDDSDWWGEIPDTGPVGVAAVVNAATVRFRDDTGLRVSFADFQSALRSSAVRPPPSAPPPFDFARCAQGDVNPQSVIRNPQSAIRPPPSALRPPHSALGLPPSAFHPPDVLLNASEIIPPGPPSKGGLYSRPLLSFASQTDTTGRQIRINRASLPPQALVPIDALNVRDADVRDLFRGIGIQYDLNLIVDNQIERRVTARLANIPVIDALVFLCEENDLSLVQDGALFRVRGIGPPPPPQKKNTIIVEGHTLTVDLEDQDVRSVARAIAEQSNLNISVRQGVGGTVSGFLQDVPLQVGIRTLFANNGFIIREQEGIFLVDSHGSSTDQEGMPRGSRSWVSVTEAGIDIDVVEANVLDVVREAAAQLNLDLVTYSNSDTRISAKASGLSLDQLFQYVFRGTNLTYRSDNGVFFVGDRQMTGLNATRLFRMNHIRVEGIIDLIPSGIQQRASIQLIREQNALMVIGTNDVMYEIDEFLRQIDRPTPQILIEALVVDFNTSDLNELGLSFGRGPRPDTSSPGHFFRFDERGYELQAGGDKINDYLDSWRSILGITTIGKLPPDFYMRIHALAREGKANIRSRPHIATLNGHPATISIGTTQYYILRSSTPIQSPGQVFPFESERFEKVDAHVRLKIVPWVSASGEVTAEIYPEFSTPVGRLDPAVPPTINTRVLDATVRLRDGETIILGGLIQDAEVAEYNKIPILGDIPLLGHLFRSRRVSEETSELVIYITPHVFYGDERDAAKWDDLRDTMDYTEIRDLPLPTEKPPPNRRSW